MGWNGCGGSPGTNLEDLGWYERSGIAMGGMGLVKSLRETYENRQTKSSNINVFTSVFANVFRRIY